MKIALPVLSPTVTTKSFGWISEEPLKTIPVGAEFGSDDPSGSGILTTNGKIVPSPRYSVDRPVPLSAIQTGPNGLNAMPHALTRFGSVTSAFVEPSDTKLCCV